METKREDALDSKSGFRYILIQPKITTESLPLVLFLHGADQIGDNLSMLDTIGPIKLALEKSEILPPCFIAAPQCTNRLWWNPENLNYLIQTICDTHPIDKSRIYGTGYSMGSHGIWRLAGGFPDLFAAIVPVSGGGEFDKIQNLTRLPVWAFHCNRDPVAPYSHIQDFVEELQEAGNKNITLTTYDSAEHDAWTITLENKNVWKWMFEQIKKN